MNVPIFFMKFLSTNAIHPIHRTKIKFYRSYCLGPPQNTFYGVLWFERPLEYDIKPSLTWSIHFTYILEIFRPRLFFLTFKFESVRHNAINHSIANKAAIHCWRRSNSHIKNFFSKEHEKFPFKISPVLSFNCFSISSSVFSVVPTGDNNTSLFTFFPYFSKYKVAI